MSTEHENGGDDFDRDLVRRYREASAGLDERPSASTRAAILAAAAREVQAKPVVAGTAYRVVQAGLGSGRRCDAFNSGGNARDSNAGGNAAVQRAGAQAAVQRRRLHRLQRCRHQRRKRRPARKKWRARSQSAPAPDLARNAESRQSATRDAALNSQRVRESDQACDGAKQAEAGRRGARAERTEAGSERAHAGHRARQRCAGSAAARRSRVTEDATSDTPPAAAETAVAVSALKKAQRETNAGLAASRRIKRRLPPPLRIARTDAAETLCTCALSDAGATARRGRSKRIGDCVARADHPAADGKVATARPMRN